MLEEVPKFPIRQRSPNAHIYKEGSVERDSYLIKPEDSKTGMLLALSEVLAPFEFCLRSLEYNGR